MSSKHLAKAPEHAEQVTRVKNMIAKLHGLLAGRLTRCEVIAWTREMWPPENGQGGPFRWGTAASVFDSIWNLDKTWGDNELVREVDLRAYLRWLVEGESFQGEELVSLRCNTENLATQVGADAIRWWLDGIGWCTDVRFCRQTHGGALFLAQTRLERPECQMIYRRHGDDPHSALLDLFEALAIDERDCVFIHEDIELERVPTWVLWRTNGGSRSEMARFRSYSKANVRRLACTAEEPGFDYSIEESRTAT